MPFTISPAEAQAIQEDEVQLLNAIAQIAQRVPGVFRVGSNNGQQQPTDALRIQMGRRIADALQQPVTPGVNPDQYTN